MIPQIAKTIIAPIPSVTSGWSDPMPIIPKMVKPINVAILGMMCVHRARFACGFVSASPTIQTIMGNKIGANSTLKYDNAANILFPFIYITS